MPAPAFALTVPAAAPFRKLAADAVRYWLCRGKDDTREAFVARVAEAVDRVAAHGAEVEMTVAGDAGAFEVRLSCGGRTETLTHPAVQNR